MTEGAVLYQLSIASCLDEGMVLFTTYTWYPAWIWRPGEVDSFYQLPIISCLWGSQLVGNFFAVCSLVKGN